MKKSVEKVEKSEEKVEKKEDNKTVLETSKKEEITISGNKDSPKETKVPVTTATVTSNEEPKSNEEKKGEEQKTQPQQNFMYYPMMMYPPTGQTTNMAMPMPMTMPTTTEGGDKTAQQPMIYMMPVCVFDSSKMPKDMKMPNMQFPFFPYPMPYPQSTTESK